MRGVLRHGSTSRSSRQMRILNGGGAGVSLEGEVKVGVECEEPNSHGSFPSVQSQKNPLFRVLRNIRTPLDSESHNSLELFRPQSTVDLRNINSHSAIAIGLASCTKSLTTPYPTFSIRGKVFAGSRILLRSLAPRYIKSKLQAFCGNCRRHV